VEGGGVHASLVSPDEATESFAIACSSPIEVGIGVTHLDDYCMATGRWTTAERQALGPASAPAVGFEQLADETRGQVRETRQCASGFGLGREPVADALGAGLARIRGALACLEVEHVQRLGAAERLAQRRDPRAGFAQRIGDVVGERRDHDLRVVAGEADHQRIELDQHKGA